MASKRSTIEDKILAEPASFDGYDCRPEAPMSEKRRRDLESGMPEAMRDRIAARAGTKVAAE